MIEPQESCSDFDSLSTSDGSDSFESNLSHISSVTSDQSVVDDYNQWILPEPVKKKARKQYRKTDLAKQRKQNQLTKALLDPNYQISYIPRILKSDIRRQYGTMFTNVFNSADYDIMYQYVRTFSAPNKTCKFESTGILF
jgi:hypothetical protein